jgi:hypothetical protein
MATFSRPNTKLPLTLHKPSYVSCLWAAAFLFLLFVRRSSQLIHPQIWDEEGTQIIPGFLKHGLMSLDTPVNGYLVTVPKIIMGISLSVSSLHLPLIATVLTWLFIAGVCMAIAKAPTWLKGGVLICLATLLVPTDPEVFGISLYSFWWASLLLFLVVLWEDKSANISWRVTFVFLGGLSSPVIFLITPFLAMRTLIFKPRSREAVVLIAASVCCIVQVLAMHHSNQPIAHGTINIHNLRLIVPKFLGSYLTGNFPGATDKLLWFSAGIVVSFLIASVSFVTEQPRYLFLLGLWAGTILLSAARVDLSLLHPRLGGPRYFFFPYVLLSWYLVSILVESKRGGLRWAAGTLLFISLLNVLPVLSRSHSDFRWTDHVVSCGQFDHYRIPISFDGYTPWFMDLDHTQCERLQHWGIIPSSRRLERERSYPYSIESVDDKVLESKGLTTSGFASTSSVVAAGWADSKDNIPGFKVFGSRGSNNGAITLRLRRGEKVLFRAGGPGERQYVSVQGQDRFLQRLPPITSWVILDFANNSLPDEFVLAFSDMGKSAGDWSSIALQE